MSALAEALVAAQAELPCAIGKDADGQIGQRSYRYLTLDKLIAGTRPILQAHGLTITQWPCYIERGGEALAPGLRTDLRHVGGELDSWVTPLYLTEKTMQGLGAAITYARRYAWQSVLGIAAEEDTDAKDEIPFWAASRIRSRVPSHAGSAATGGRSHRRSSGRRSSRRRARRAGSHIRTDSRRSARCSTTTW